ncbi:hypothetical protein AVEN_238857-1 [Araneus ventricosus]|uniref:Uncharacterized protein n=1 Tax=Araneus ventricosus TaxID=182803 RepID=A0A4Y2EMM2_ARAVE|nr:hypothetical protein AVEN_238857-1 [Araneus ventricosus]
MVSGFGHNVTFSPLSGITRVNGAQGMAIFDFKNCLKPSNSLSPLSPFSLGINTSLPPTRCYATVLDRVSVPPTTANLLHVKSVEVKRRPATVMRKFGGKRVPAQVQNSESNCIHGDQESSAEHLRYRPYALPRALIDRQPVGEREEKKKNGTFPTAPMHRGEIYPRRMKNKKEQVFEKRRPSK